MHRPTLFYFFIAALFTFFTTSCATTNEVDLSSIVATPPTGIPITVESPTSAPTATETVAPTPTETVLAATPTANSAKLPENTEDEVENQNSPHLGERVVVEEYGFAYRPLLNYDPSLRFAELSFLTAEPGDLSAFFYGQPPDVLETLDATIEALIAAYEAQGSTLVARENLQVTGGQGIKLTYASTENDLEGNVVEYREVTAILEAEDGRLVGYNAWAPLEGWKAVYEEMSNDFIASIELFPLTQNQTVAVDPNESQPNGGTLATNDQVGFSLIAPEPFQPVISAGTILVKGADFETTQAIIGAGLLEKPASSSIEDWVSEVKAVYLNNTVDIVSERESTINGLAAEIFDLERTDKTGKGGFVVIYDDEAVAYVFSTAETAYWETTFKAVFDQVAGSVKLLD